jgi:UDP-GlcNAc:undecaprenyl-phosphate GlcNAc-1-phosphate transferase
MLNIFAFIIVFCLSLSVSLAVMPLARYLSFRFDITSIPGGRRQEQDPMPKLGGLAVFLGFVITVIVAQFLAVPRFDPLEVVRLSGLLIGSTLIFIVGVIDDWVELNYYQSFLAQIVVAVIAIVFQIFIEFFNNPFTGQLTDPWSPIITVTLTMFWLVLMMNTVNFLDGSDGLAAGVAVIAGIILFLNSAFRLEPAQISVSLLPLALSGASLGFLLHNFYPAKIYLGGSAWFLGYVLGALSIIGGAKMATILLVMGLPLMDLGWQVLIRLREGRNPFRGDRGHLHFRLLDTGRFTPRQIAIGYYVICSVFGLLTLVTTSQLFKFIAFGVMMIFVVIGFIAVGRISVSEQD